jgi:exosome complex RNA-binding protein Rrp4
MFDNWVLELLGKHLAFEIIIGVNGRFIVNATKPTYVIKIANIIRNSPNHDAKWVMEKIKSVARG